MNEQKFSIVSKQSHAAKKFAVQSALKLFCIAS
jgi:hypothetical protein